MRDTIYRDDAIKEIKAEACLGIVECQEGWLIDSIKAIPSADRPRGELKYMGTYYKCSVCGSEFMDEITFMGELNYCPHCGARMKGADDE